MTTLPQLRRDLAKAKIALREAKDYHETIRAITEQRAIDKGASGKNAEERARALTIALVHDNDYQQTVLEMHEREDEAGRIAVEIAIKEDEIRANEARIREKLADALGPKTIDLSAEDKAAIAAAHERIMAHYR